MDTGYKRNFKLECEDEDEEILSLIGIVTTTKLCKVGPEKIIHICMVFLKEK